VIVKQSTKSLDLLPQRAGIIGVVKTIGLRCALFETGLCAISDDDSAFIEVYKIDPVTKRPNTGAVLEAHAAHQGDPEFVKLFALVKPA
jgi:hypothetical protein